MNALTDKTAVVTGAGSGIGRTIARQFASEDVKVVVADIAEDEGTATVEQIEEDGGHAIFVRTDVTDPDATEAMVETAREAYGQLDIAVNNAGISGDSAPIAEQTPENWDRVIDINLTGVWNAMKAEIPPMLEAGSGAIVNTASILGKVGFPGAAPYVASKHAVIGLTKTAAIEYASEGLRINAVCPGFIRTPMLERAGITTDQTREDAIADRHPAGRLGRPEEIAAAVGWLSSDAASFVNGEAMDVDGGYLSQ